MSTEEGGSEVDASRSLDEDHSSDNDKNKDWKKKQMVKQNKPSDKAKA